MLRIDASAKTLTQISSTTLTQAKILLRTVLQAAIINSWDAFVSELGYEELFFIGSEVTPHDSCRDRIDILGLSRDGTPVVFELKRHRDRLQLLQALSYAAMVSKWDKKRFQQELGGRSGDDAEEVASLLADEAFELSAPEVVLIAESFEPEAILATEWLAGFGVPVSAFAIGGIEHKGETLISIDQRFPLTAIDELYVSRNPRPHSAADRGSWDEALKNVSFSFARKAVDVFRKHTEGSPQRRQFDSIYSGSSLGRMKIAFKREYLKVYTVDQSPECEKALRDAFGSVIPIKPWGNESTKNSGFTFQIETEAQFQQFLKAVGEPAA